MEYKDVQRVHSTGSRTKWRRYRLDQIELWVEKAKSRNSRHIFTTIQTFYNSDGEKDKNEPSLTGFYADFDGEDDLTIALQDARKVVEYWLKLNVPAKYIQIYFSGKKGFHVVIEPEIFGASSRSEIHRIWHIVANHLVKTLGLKTLDQVVYRKRGMWRVPNTLNYNGEDSLYKIPLAIEDFFDISLEQIKSAAKTEQEIPFEVYDGKPLREASNLYKTCERKYENSKHIKDWEAVEVDFDKPPACVQALLDNGVFELGTVNMVTYRLAAYFKTQGVEFNDTTSILNEWAKNIKPEVTHSITNTGVVDIESIRKQIEYVCITVYSNIQYGFSCGGILQVPGLGDICTKECKEKVESKVEVSLFDAFDIKYKGVRLYIDAEAVGRQDETIAIPDKVKVWCTPLDTAKCQECHLYECRDGIDIELTAKNKGILLFIDPSNIDLTGRIGKLAGLPKRGGSGGCSAWRYSIIEQNCEIITLTPRVTNEFQTGDRYIRHSAYFMGFGLEPNRGYRFSGYLHVHDKTSRKKLVLDKADPLEDTLAEFTFTDEMKEQSKIFRPGVNETYKLKHNHIADTFAYNYIRVWGRSELIRFVDLIYHTVTQFWFQRVLVNGWGDGLVIGDTGQGKSTIVKIIMELYNLGIKVSAESARRTGLTYTIPIKENAPAHIVWGIIPRYDRRLVCVDELDSLVAKGDFSELTDIRSDGYIAVTQTVFGQANARTRMLWLSNTIGGGKRSMKSYGFPVMAVSDLIKSNQDIRRFTMAMGVTTDEVPDDLINMNIDDMEPFEDIYTSEICHNHLLWVWNLSPDDVIISKEIEIMILSLANHLCREYIPAVPLVEPGDIRLKLARISVAAAARMDSRDDDKLIVCKEAVEYAYDFLNGIYASKAFKYFEYSVAYAEYAYSEEDLETLANSFKEQWPYNWEKLGKLLLTTIYIKVRELSAAIPNLEDKYVRECLDWMAGKRIVESSSRGVFTKTPVGVKFFETLLPSDNIPSVKTAGEVLEGDEEDEF